jgi:hypothetical protein
MAGMVPASTGAVTLGDAASAGAVAPVGAAGIIAAPLASGGRDVAPLSEDLVVEDRLELEGLEREDPEWAVRRDDRQVADVRVEADHRVAVDRVIVSIGYSRRASSPRIRSKGSAIIRRPFFDTQSGSGFTCANARCAANGKLGGAAQVDPNPP